MTIDDYMKLPKRRLAELLAERDAMDSLNKITIVPIPDHLGTHEISDLPKTCNGDICTNPFRDCINCPSRWKTV